MTLNEKIGQLLCCGWSEPAAYLNLNSQALRCVQDLHVGSFLLMGRNVQRTGTPAAPVDRIAVRRMTAILQSIAGPIPLLIATDQEGGRVQRLRAPFTRIPPAEAVGAANDPDLARQVGVVIGRELAAVGINWDFAPVCDLRTGATNREIGDRSFGGDPAITGGLISAQMSGIQSAGVMPCLKHFPGQGDTPVDSHIGLPSLARRDYDDLQARELVTFTRAMRDTAAGSSPLSLMAAHMLVPKVDPSGLPASLSPALITGVLRQRLGFDGIVVTDDLEMEPIAKGWGVGQAAVMAINAGADVVLVCHTIPAQQEAYDALLQAAKSGRLPVARIEEANRRVLSAKRWAASQPSIPLSVIGCAEHQAVVDKLRPARA